MNFEFVTIHVTELEPSIKIYEEVIGLKTLQRFSAETDQEIVFLDGGGVRVELIAHKNVTSISHDSHRFQRRDCLDYRRTQKNKIENHSVALSVRNPAEFIL